MDEIKNMDGDYDNMNLLFDAACGHPLVWTENGHVKYLTRETAIKKYGPITKEEHGPRGGWRSVTFGTTIFISPRMKGTWTCPRIK